MLVTIPNTLYGRIGAVLCALIVTFSLIGLTMHKDFYAGQRRKDFFCYYTNLSNLIVLIYFSLIAPYLHTSAALSPLIPHAEFAVMMCIMLTFTVFHLMIFPAVRLAAQKAPRTRSYYIVLVDNAIIHYIVPLLVFLYWLLCSAHKDSLRLWDAVLWTLIPTAYLLWILSSAHRRGVIEETGSPYPYPFLDIGALGHLRVSGICLLLYCACLLAGIGIIIAAKAFYAHLGGGHALVLI